MMMTTKPKHAPGPWRALIDNSHDVIRIIDVTNTLVTELPLWSYSDERVKADAHLIAAAPELLAACQAAWSIMWMAESYAEAGGPLGPEYRDFAKAHDAVRAAIKKARGES